MSERRRKINISSLESSRPINHRPSCQTIYDVGRCRDRYRRNDSLAQFLGSCAPEEKTEFKAELRERYCDNLRRRIKSFLEYISVAIRVQAALKIPFSSQGRRINSFGMPGRRDAPWKHVEFPPLIFPQFWSGWLALRGRWIPSVSFKTMTTIVLP